jgi:hypothetical protein
MSKGDSESFEPTPDDLDHERLHSVHNEPAIFPGQSGRLVDVDFPCRRCGYNLRGSTMGQACPECGDVAIYAPPPSCAGSYSSWAEREISRTSPGHSAIFGALCVLGTAILGLGGAFASVPLAGCVVPFVLGPIIEEAAKILALAWILDAKPYVFTSRRSIYAVAAIGAAGYAAVENGILYALMASPTPFETAFRWAVCLPLHVVLSLVATFGLAQMWTKAMRDRVPPSFGDHAMPLVAAVLLHGAYNAVMYFWPMQSLLI